MPQAVIMPMLGMAQDTGTLIRWLKAEGDWVDKGQPLMEIETDKVTVEIEAPASGLLAHVSIAEGETVPVGHTIAYLLAQGESPLALVGSEGEGAPTLSDPTRRVSPVARAVAAAHDVDALLVPVDGKLVRKDDVLAYVSGRLPALAQKTAALSPASPLARRLAAEQALDLKSIVGSGPEGAVLAADVRSLLAGASNGTAPEAQLQPQPEAPTVSRAWQVMAERLASGWSTTPHFYLTREVQAGRLIKWQAHAEKRLGYKVTYTDLLVKAAATALRLHPQLNSSWRSGARQSNTDVHVGIAVAAGENLLVPVISHADRLGVGAIAAALQDLVERARAGTLRPADLQGGTFTISNLGMFGVDAFSAIVNPGQAAILAVGRIADRVLAVDGKAVVCPALILTLSCDHRITDGANAAAFFQSLVMLLEQPLALLD